MTCNILLQGWCAWYEKTSEKRSGRTSNTLLPRYGFCVRGVCSGGFIRLCWTQLCRRGECRSGAYSVSARCLGTDSCSRGINVSGTLADSGGMDSEDDSLDCCMDPACSSINRYFSCFVVHEHPRFLRLGSGIEGSPDHDADDH